MGSEIVVQKTRRKPIPIGFRSTRMEVVCEVPVPEGKSDKGARRFVLAKCDCSTEKVVDWRSLKSGKTQSCGCLRSERVSKAQTKHGACKEYRRTPEYRSWVKMISRCTNPNDDHYHDYGGRGISIEWLDFESFLADMGKKPSNALTIERADTNGNYCKDNCHWATRMEQNQNTRASKRWLVDGVWYNRSQDAADAHGVGNTTILAWCDGSTDKRRGKHYPPKKGCKSELKYPEPA